MLVGHHKNYEVNFQRGLNIIYGDSETGKSSILGLINYLLGSKKIDLYDEIEQAGKYCLLEAELNGKIYTIKRDIFLNNSNIEVYPSTIESMDEVFPLEFSVDYSKEGPAGFFSDFLLDALDIPKIRVKQAPSKDESPLARLSFRDIFKFCYLNQDEVGSRDLLDNDNPIIYTKVKETFKFIHNILDSQLAELQDELSRKTKEKGELEARCQAVASFLREVKIESIEELEVRAMELAQDISLVEHEVAQITANMRSDNQYFNELRNIISISEAKMKDYKQKIEEVRFNLEQHIALKKEYQNDIEKLKASIDMANKLPNSPTQTLHTFSCPLCNSTTRVSNFLECLDDNGVDALKNELRSLKSRSTNLDRHISEQRNNCILLEQDLGMLMEETDKTRELLDIKTSDYISPYVQQRDSLISRKAALTEERNKIEYLRKVRKQLDELCRLSQKLKTQIEDIKHQITELQKTSPSPESVTNSLGDVLSDFLSLVGIYNPYGIRINEKSFLPIVREREYDSLSSGGLRTIASIGYILSLLVRGLHQKSNLPSFVMLDTVSKYLGKTKNKYLEKTDSKADLAEGVSDPMKRVNMFKYLIRLHKRHGHEFQMILVDNDIPSELELLLGAFTAKRFSVVGQAGLSIGFIDDARHH